MSRKGEGVPCILEGTAPQNTVRKYTAPVYSVLSQTVLIDLMQFIVWHHEVSYVTKV